MNLYQFLLSLGFWQWCGVLIALAIVVGGIADIVAAILVRATEPPKENPLWKQALERIGSVEAVPVKPDPYPKPHPMPAKFGPPPPRPDIRKDA